MAIKVHGLPFSIATQRVLVTLAEKELDYEFVYIDLATGQQKTEDFVKLHVSITLLTHPVFFFNYFFNFLILLK